MALSRFSFTIPSGHLKACVAGPEKGTTANSFGPALRPQATPKLMNFQNLFGIIKRF